MTSTKKTLQSILERTVDNKKVFGTSFSIKKGDFSWEGAAGNISTNQAYFIASVTKLFTTSLILQLSAKGDLALEDKISKYLNPRIWKDLHIYKGRDYSSDLTIKQLLSHTSGLSDYFQQKSANGKSLEAEIVNGEDQFWTFEQVIENSKAMKALFAPDSKNKAHYSDTNFQLLGKIIENITQQSYADNCKERIIDPLGLNQSYLYQDTTDKKPITLYYKSNELHIPKAMASFGADGGIVSTSADLLLFIEAFFTGKLFPIQYIQALQEWNKIFFPMRSGIGIHLLKLPWFFDPTGAMPTLLGHSGLSGTVAFYSPKEKVFIAGTVNQVAHPDLAIRTMMKLVRVLKNS